VFQFVGVGIDPLLNNLSRRGGYLLRPDGLDEREQKAESAEKYCPKISFHEQAEEWLRESLLPPSL